MTDGVMKRSTLTRQKAAWDVQSIDGWTARMSKLQLDEVDLNAEIGWRLDYQLFQFQHPEEIHGLIREVYGYWVQLGGEGDFHFVEGTSKAGQLASKLKMICQQLTHTEEVGVDIDANGQPFIQYQTLRARMAFEASRDLFEKPTFRECQQCGGLFPLKRSDAKYCSGRCQTAHWRQKKGG